MTQTLENVLEQSGVKGITGQEIKPMAEAVHAEDMGVEDFLEHFGVKGMHWGRRTADSGSGGGGSAPSARQRNRELNKASRAKDKAAGKAESAEAAAKRKEDILGARDRVYNGGNAEKIAAAKAQYKADKIAVGSREARKALAKVQNDAWDDVYKSQEYLDGKEAAKDILTKVALLPVGRVGEVASGLARNSTIKKSVKR